MAIVWRELFPTKLTFLIFILYMSLFIGQGIFVTASQESNNSYSYNTITVVLLTEVLKLIVSATLYCRENNFTSLIKDVRKDSKVMMLYFVPAFLYCLYNNLAFVNLSTFDPTTYYLLLQLRVVITGILFQIIFKKYLSQRQWISLVLLTAGCMLKQLNFNGLYASDDTAPSVTKNYNQDIADDVKAHSLTFEKNMSGFDFSLSAVFILAQTICSCLAGVYNEYLLKDKGSEVNIFVQNVFMYLDSIVCNVVILLISGDFWSAFTTDSLSAIFRFKTFASALELMFTAVLCYFLFSIPIYINTALAIAVVSFAIYLYSQSPVVNLGKVRPLNSLSEANTSSATSQEKRKFLDSEGDTDLEMDMV
ncbi:hypothetical protein DOY81_005051 [Sarcophaga bullata]|nr:hypothetical protein DOY81_005051 [Sarcophaga bullata]